MNLKKKYEKSFKDHHLNPELLRVEIDQCNLIDKEGRLNKLNTHSYNSKINSNPSSRIINHNIGIDAKIKHRKRREGD
ncbi:MAG: hypothetical protein ACFFDN_24455 [Candidatus Hodarchaeota archaeon]